MSELCIVLLRNLSTVLHSSKGGTLLHLLSNAACPRPPLKRSRFPFGLMSLSVTHCWQFTSIETLEPTNWFVKWCPLLLVCLLLWLPGYLFVCHAASSKKHHVSSKQDHYFLGVSSFSRFSLEQIFIWIRADKFYYVLSGTRYVCWSSGVPPLAEQYRAVFWLPFLTFVPYPWCYLPLHGTPFSFSL